MEANGVEGGNRFRPLELPRSRALENGGISATLQTRPHHMHVPFSNQPVCLLFLLFSVSSVELFSDRRAEALLSGPGQPT